MSWSGNYETVFKETVVDPFNAQCGTMVESVGGWDQMVPQILAAPVDTPPFDITVGEVYVSLQGIAQGLFRCRRGRPARPADRGACLRRRIRALRPSMVTSMLAE